MSKQRLNGYGVPSGQTFTPTFRFQLVAQNAPRAQASLFATAIEPTADQACEHPDSQLQRTFAGGEDRTCTSCGAVLEASCSCCWHYRGTFECEGVDCQACENCDPED